MSNDVLTVSGAGKYFRDFRRQITSLKGCPNVNTSSRLDVFDDLTMLDVHVTTNNVHSIVQVLQGAKALKSLHLKVESSVAEQIGTVVAMFPACHHLTTFKMYGDAGSSILGTVMSSLVGCKLLQHLDLSHCSLGDKGMVEVSDFLETLTDLRSLRLSNNEIRLVGIQTLSLALPRCQKLELLDLSRNIISVDAVSSLCQSLKQCHALTNLNLRHTYLSTKVVGQFVPILERLTVLDMAENFFGCNVMTSLHTTMFPKLQHLDLSYNNLNDGGAATFAEFIGHCQNLKTLILEKNHIGAKSSTALSYTLPSCQQLEILKISWNDNIGSPAFYECLPLCPKLRVLHMEACNMGDRQTILLAQSLAFCTNLQELHLGNNYIENAGVYALGDHLKSLTQLKKVRLAHNAIGLEDKGQAIHGLLTKCAHLQELDFYENCIRSNAVEKLSKVLPTCKHLRTLDLTCNELNKRDIQVLKQSFKKTLVAKGNEF